MSTDLLPVLRPDRPAWNKGRIIGQKRPLTLSKGIDLLEQTSAFRQANYLVGFAANDRFSPFLTFLSGGPSS